MEKEKFRKNKQIKGKNELESIQSMNYNEEDESLSDSL